MWLDKLGNKLQVGDPVTIDPQAAQFTKCKVEVGWVVQGILEHSTVTEVVAFHRESNEVASFPLTSVFRTESIKKFIDSIAPKRGVREK